HPPLYEEAYEIADAAICTMGELTRRNRSGARCCVWPETAALRTPCGGGGKHPPDRLRALRRYPNPHMNAAVRRRAFAHDFGILVQPMKPRAIGRLERDVEDNPAACEPRFNRGTKIVEALPRQRRSHDRVAVRKPLGAAPRRD